MKTAFTLFFLVALAIVSCKKEQPVHPKSADNSILSFSILKADNPAISSNVTAVLTGDTIKIALPSEWPTKLKVNITVSNGAVIADTLPDADFSQPVHYTIVAEDGSQREYVTSVVVVPPPQLSALVINGAPCPFDSVSNTFYFPVSPESPLTSFTVQFDTTVVKNISFQDVAGFSGKTVSLPLKVNDQIRISANDAFNDHTPYKLLITGLPLVVLQGDENVRDDYEGVAFSIIDPDYQSHNGDFYVHSQSGIKLRGATSRGFDKKPYALQMWDGTGDKQDISIMGLRSDQAWILDAMYIDKAKMRNRLCTDIWNSINNVPYIEQEPDALNGTRGYLTEVFFNHEYRGVYTLTEKLDRKQLKVKKKKGFVYKSGSWTNAVQFIAASSYDNSSETWDGWELSYPDAGDDRPMDWTYLYNMVRFVSTATDSDFTKDISQYVDLDNMVDYLLFINAVGAADNVAKNAYFSMYDSTKSKQFFYSVWDLDGTMGRNWDGSYYQNGSFTFLGTSGSTVNQLFHRLIVLNPDGFISKLKARWNDLKVNQLNPSVVDALIRHYGEELIYTGAAQREAIKWKGSINDITTETDYMISWYAAHLYALDDYINHL